MNSRRKFLQGFSTLSAATLLPFFQSPNGRKLIQSLEVNSGLSGADLEKDEDFWHLVKQAYTVSPSVLNLNNGGVCPSPKVVQEAVERYNRLSNEAPSHYMWHILDRQGKEPLRQKLADLAGCSNEEIAINRNSSEALETVIFGLQLKKGDEVVLSKQDYPNMIHAWKQREHRDGIVLKWISLDPIMEDEAAITERYTAAFSPKTKVVHITHLINWSGQILPVKSIAQKARDQGIEVLVDGAHTFAHIDFNIPDLDCDYYGTSLHKWLCAPFGSGMLYVKKEKIRALYPLLAAPKADSDDIRKFEHLGTRSIAIEQGIGQAVDFHQMIGSKRKEARLRFLKNYWTSRVLSLKGVSVNSTRHPEYSCAIALLAVDGMSSSELAGQLMRKFQIHSVAIEWENISGVRITPNVYTLSKDLDRLVEAVKHLAKT